MKKAIILLEARRELGSGVLNKVNRLRNFIELNLQTLPLIRKLNKKYPDAEINILAHSFGTYISYEAIRQAGKDKKAPIRINKLILVGGIVSSHENFKDTIGEGLIKEVYNYCSYDDRVVRFNPLFGHCGYIGFLPIGRRDHVEMPWPGVKNCRFEVRHSQWFDDDPPDFYRAWLNNIMKGAKDE